MSGYDGETLLEFSVATSPSRRTERGDCDKAVVVARFREVREFIARRLSALSFHVERLDDHSLVGRF